MFNIKIKTFNKLTAFLLQNKHFPKKLFYFLKRFSFKSKNCK